MKTILPHFGTVTTLISDCLYLGETPDNQKPEGVIKERTGRTIAAGQPVKAKTWDTYAADLVDALTAFPILPLLGEDRSRLTASFHSYRQSYELLNSELSGLPAKEATLRRAVLRLTIIDFGVRHAALCVAEGTQPPAQLPSWSQPNGANQFWRHTMESKFPGVTLVGAADCDCAVKLQMHPSKFKRCLYENDFPGMAPLHRVFPDQKELVLAVRHYAAYCLCRQLANEFDQQELDSWLESWLAVSGWLHKYLDDLLPRLNDAQRAVFLPNLFSGGASSKTFSGILKMLGAEKIPVRFRADLVAMAGNDPMSSITNYAEFCNYWGDSAPAGSWENSYLRHRAEMEHFFHTGEFPDEQRPSTKLLLTRMFHHASEKKDLLLEEKILRKIINDYPHDAEARQLLAQLCDRTGRKEEARGWYWRAYQTNPEFTLPLYRLADSLSCDGLHQKALAVAFQIPEPGVKRGSRQYLLGLCMARSGHYASAVVVLELAFHAGWKQGECAGLLAYCSEHQAPSNDQAAKAVKYWRKMAMHHGFRLEDVPSLLSSPP